MRMSGRIMFSDKLGDDGGAILLLLVAAKLVDHNVTVNVFEVELDPWVAITGTGPIDDGGMVKLAKKIPLLVVVMLSL
jgi:hypothetical protein